MATRDFEVQQLFKAFRSGVISEELFAKQMDEFIGTADIATNGRAAVPNVFSYRSADAKISAKTLQKTAQSQSMVFTLPANYSGDRENSHKGDQIIYVIDGGATCRVSGQEQQIKAGDLVTIPAGAPHSLRTGNEALFALTVFAPPEEQMR
jgi:quercetin dioxygenase-like cupin family protein